MELLKENMKQNIIKCELDDNENCYYLFPEKS